MFYFDSYHTDELTPREQIVWYVIIDGLNEENKSLHHDWLMNGYINWLIFDRKGDKDGEKSGYCRVSCKS